MLIKISGSPRKEDTEQGGKVANKADDFLTIHRITQHPTGLDGYRNTRS